MFAKLRKHQKIVFKVKITPKNCFSSCENTYQPGVPDYAQKVGGSCKNLTKMYQCHIKSSGETYDCKDKAQCLEIMVKIILHRTGNMCDVIYIKC